MIAWDTETLPIQPALLAPPLVCVSWAGEGEPRLVHVEDPHARINVEGLLEQETTTANGLYDLAVVGAQWPELIPPIFDALSEGRVHDVSIRQKLIDIAEGCYRFSYATVNGKRKKLGYSLSDLNLRYFGSEMEKDEWRTKYGLLRDVPLDEWPEGAKKYAITDAERTLAVHEAQEEYAEHLVDEMPQVRAAWALHLMSCWGIQTDDAAVTRYLKTLDVGQQALHKKLLAEGLVDAKGKRETKAAKARMKSILGDKAPTTKKGQISLDKDACDLAADPLLSDYQTYSSHQTLRSKVAALKTGHLPIQTRFEVLMETGRTSSSANDILPNSAAIQNLPRAEGMRECFVPRPGHALVACDYDKAELVSLAQICLKVVGWSNLANALNAGMDPHLDMASNLLNVSYDEAFERRDEKLVKEMRQGSKAANFGYPGGCSARTFQVYAYSTYGLKLSEQEAVNLKAGWHRKWPEMEHYFEWIDGMMDDEGFANIEHYMSRRRRGHVPYTVACNSFFQGLTADAAKAAMYEVCRRCYSVPESALYGCRPVNFVHDELILEVPLDRLHEAAMELKYVMETWYNKFTPDVPVRATPAAMFRWSKNAEPVYDSGRLVPWGIAA